MRLQCPTCSLAIDVIDGEVTDRITCPSCGSQVDLSGHRETLTYVPPKLGHLGHFELLAHIGRGHFGDVYRAKDSRLERIVAVKLPRTADLDASDREAFFREARAAARLRHPNIVAVHEVGTAGDTVFIASEFIQGANLAELISARRLAPRQAAEIAALIAAALHHAHEQGIIHRDLKPRNVILDESGQPHLLDFGLAKQLAADFTITSDGEILGTPAYMAPEQARGQSGSADRRTDVYALGVTLYEMLTGERPFQGDIRGLLHRVLHEEPLPPRRLVKDLPRDLETICLKAMAKQPASRYASAAEMSADLRRYLAGEPIQARPVGLAERGWRWCRRNPALSLTSAVAVVAVAVALSLAVSGVFGRQQALAPPLETRSQFPPHATHEPPDPAFKYRVAIETEPSGATVICYPLDFFTSRPDFAARVVATTRTPTEMELVNGMYLVVAFTDEAFHEVLRSVPRQSYTSLGAFPHEATTWDTKSQVLHWPRIRLFPHSLPDEQLVEIAGTEKFQIDHTPVGGLKETLAVPPFLIEAQEVSVEKFQRLSNLRFAGRKKNLPANNLSWGQAVAYAESRGLRLPELAEVEWLATAQGKHKYPWGDRLPPADNWDSDRPVDATTHDQSLAYPQIIGLHSGTLEWLATRTRIGYGTDGPGLRYLIRGGSVRLIDQPALVDDAGPWVSVNEHVSNPAIGVRCARSLRGRTREKDFVATVGEDHEE